tara:strand:- start:12785 stop:13609 length:825 start_codon:yes stop_codon:yes gene_type:complete
MAKVIFNHKLVDKKDLNITIDNRSFLYGDGLFESIKIINGKPFNLINHLNRLIKISSLINLELNISIEEFESMIFNLIKSNDIRNGGIIKIIIYREAGGKYLPKTNKSSFIILSKLTSNNIFKLNSIGLSLGIFREHLKQKGTLSNYKTTSAIQSVLCSIDAKNKQKDDCLMLNSDSNIIESSNSNLFYINNNNIYTPILSEGCVDGTMRNIILGFGDLKLTEKIVSLEDILSSDEVFLTNAVHGIRWVSSIEEKIFSQYTFAELMINRLNKLV